VDIKSYIASGVLENYVLNLLTEKERQEVEGYAEKYPEIRSEIERIEIALEDYARMNAIPAPSEVSVQIEAKLDSLANKSSSLQKSSDNSSSSNQILTWLLGALFLVSVYLVYYYYQKNQTTELLRQSTSQQLSDLQLACDSTSQENTILQQQLEILRAGSNKIIAMKGTEKSPQALANVIYNQEGQKSYLDIKNLPAPPSDKQYQLWAIVNGQPVDMGVFEVVVSNGFQEVPFIENAAAFAVTLENRGGSPTPTLEEMVVIGNV
jgi:anti-sigma-K factor RskA